MIPCGGWVPIHIAAIEGKTETVKVLLEHGVDISVRTKKGRTPLHFAAMPKSGRPLVQLLLRSGADPYIKDKRGQTPADIAKEYSNPNIEKMLRNFKPQANDRPPPNK